MVYLEPKCQYEVLEEAATGFLKAFVRICNRHLNTTVQIHLVFQALGIGLTLLFQILYGADDEDDEEVVFPVDWYVVYEYKCVATCVHCD